MPERTDGGPGGSVDPDDGTPPDVDVDADDADGNGGTDTGLAARVAALERTVTGLRETVERQRRGTSYLAAAADIGSVAPGCPECGLKHHL